MKKILVALLLALTALLLCAGCANQKYDYANWKSYVFPNEHSFSYPQDWEAASTENGLLYFYTTNENGAKTVMAFQSHVEPADNLFDKQTVEKNAYSDSFQGIASKHSEIGPAVGTVCGIDLIAADTEEKQLKYLEFNPQPFSDQEIKGGYTYKLFFSEKVSDETFQKIYGSCE